MAEFMPYAKPCLTASDIETAAAVMSSNWLTTGPMLEKFEQSLQQVTQASYVFACANGTAALHLAFLALELKPGDSVLVASISFLASANAVRYMGADIVFVDVDPLTGLITPDLLELAIKQNGDKSFKALVNVHLAGQCGDLKNIYKTAKKYNLMVIEDAAHAIGSQYIDGKAASPIGSNAYCDLTTFSFHAVKTIAVGEGGAVTTNNRMLAEKIKLYLNHGLERTHENFINQSNAYNNEELNPWYYEMHALGYNYRLSDVQCALGYSQLQRLNEIVDKRQELVSHYHQLLQQQDYLQVMPRLNSSKTCWHLLVALIDFEAITKSRAQLMNNLKSKGIGSQVHYIPIYQQPYYQNLLGEISLPGAELYYKKTLSLPLYLSLSKRDCQYVVETLLMELKS